jgi:2-polyprenyl-3-methyl-5-hydroxy-6-metoxy-1,4-benzoquinol methylase
MSTKTTNEIRQRIYRSYATARNTPLAPPSLAGLRPRLPYLRRLVNRYFPSDRSAEILELGCGHGALLHVLHQAGYEKARGVDVSPDQVAAAHALGIEGVERQDLVISLEDTSSASLDVVVTFDVIEHFARNELLTLVDAVYRVLRPGGSWIIHVPNAEGPFGARMRYWDCTHEIAFTRTSLDQLLKAGGFADIVCYEDRPVPHGVKSAVRASLWMIIRAGLLLFLAVETGSFDRKAVFSQNLLAVAFKDKV